MDDEIKTMFDEPADGEQEPENADMGSKHEDEVE